MNLDQLVTALADQVTASLEQNLKEACRIRLGADLPLEQLQTRLGLLSTAAGDTYYLDGVELAFVGPIEVVETSAGTSASRLFIRYKADGTHEPVEAANDVSGKTQYQQDIEALQREEERIVEQGGSPADTPFFERMGELARERGEGGRG